MKAIVVHDASGQIESVMFVADNVGYEPEPGEHVLEIDTRDIDSSLDWYGLNKESFREYRKKIVEDFRVAQGRIVRREDRQHQRPPAAGTPPVAPVRVT